MKISFVFKIIYGTVLTGLLLVAGLIAASSLDIPGNYKLLVVQSGSMEPALSRGSVVIVVPAKEYSIGDIVTFQKDSLPKSTVTHRINDKKESNGKIAFVTKGDANNVADSDLLYQDRIVGKVMMGIPFLGYPVNFAKTQLGFLLIVIIPAIVIIYSEFLVIKNEAARLIQEKKKRKLTLQENVEEKIGEEIIEVTEEIKKLKKDV